MDFDQMSTFLSVLGISFILSGYIFLKLSGQYDNLTSFQQSMIRLFLVLNLLTIPFFFVNNNSMKEDADNKKTTKTNNEIEQFVNAMKKELPKKIDEMTVLTDVRLEDSDRIVFLYSVDIAKRDFEKIFSVYSNSVINPLCKGYAGIQDKSVGLTLLYNDKYNEYLGQLEINAEVCRKN